MSFFCACPGISPQRCSACPHRGVVAESYPIRTVIQFSICPSIGRQREGSFINPLNNQLGTFLPFARKNFCKFFVNGSCNGKKSRYTAHQISGKKSLAISLMKLCTGSEIQKPSMSAFSATLADSATGAAQPQSLSAAALCFTQIFSCGSLMRAYRLYHIERLFVNLFRYIVTGKTAAVSDSRLLIDHLILFYTAFFLSAANGCYGYCTAADKQQSNPQQKIGVISRLRIFGILAAR